LSKVLVLYTPPADPAAFDRHYTEVHIPIARKIPGSVSFVTNAGPITTPGGPAPYYRVAELAFASAADLQAALRSQEFGAAAADLENFAGAGATILMYETHEA
jgi:uncharacterized protein (TIGR02118 family)